MWHLEKVSRYGYYGWRQRSPYRRKQTNDALSSNKKPVVDAVIVGMDVSRESKIESDSEV